MPGRRDAASTAAIVVAVLVLTANVRNWGLPLVGGDRASAAALAFPAAAMALAARRGAGSGDAVAVAVDVLGVGVVFLIGAGLAIGTHVVLALLTALLGLIWLLLVVRRSRG